MKTILVDAVNTLVLKGEGIFEDMYALLEKYKNTKIILTNANDDEFIKFKLANAPYDLFSLKHKPNKSESRYYELMLGHYSLNKADVIYFEHDIIAVEAARSKGITTYHYDKKGKDLKALKDFLDNNL